MCTVQMSRVKKGSSQSLHIKIQDFYMKKTSLNCGTMYWHCSPSNSSVRMKMVGGR